MDTQAADEPQQCLEGVAEAQNERKTTGKAKSKDGKPKRIIKKGVNRPHRAKTIEVLQARCSSVQRLLQKHQRLADRNKEMMDMYTAEIEWKQKEASAE